MQRSEFVKSTGIIILGTFNAKKIKLFGQSSKMAYPFTPDALPYSFDSLEPYVDKATMQLHYLKHYSGYIENLNKAIKGSSYESKDIQDIINTISDQELTIRNNGGGYLNHSFFWKCLSPHKSLPSKELNRQINESFGSLDQFKTAFSNAALNVFGSGWAWLVKGKNNKLWITTTSNQDNPQMSFVKERGLPLLGIDVWEHAYYLRYNNRRNDYLSSLWNIINWDFVSKNYLMNSQ